MIQKVPEVKSPNKQAGLHKGSKSDQGLGEGRRGPSNRLQYPNPHSVSDGQENVKSCFSQLNLDQFSRIFPALECFVSSMCYEWYNQDFSNVSLNQDVCSENCYAMLLAQSCTEGLSDLED